MTDHPRASRQSFLGAESQPRFARVHVAVLGLGGGGSHVVQQLAHVGFKNLTVCDPDRVEDTNLNRLVGATTEDALLKRPKVDIATRTVRGLAADAHVDAFFGKWEDHAEALRRADLVFGCLDGYAARRDIEEFTRRYLIPLIDVGLDVHRAEGVPPQMSGQVILSMPGEPCMWCLGYLNDIVLRREAEKYGDAGARPQVVWGNGVLASAAVGIAVDLLTGWTGRRPPIFLEYDGNKQTLAPPERMQLLPARGPCPHYPDDDVARHGDPVFQAR
jgi:hypothetical protein